MLGTRGMLAIMAGVTMASAVVALRSDRRPLGLSLLTAGFFLASVWSGLSVYWATDHSSLLSYDSHLMLGTMAVTATVYYGVLAKESISNE